jgi:hypothetical protein
MRRSQATPTGKFSQIQLAGLSLTSWKEQETRGANGIRGSPRYRFRASLVPNNPIFTPLLGDSAVGAVRSVDVRNSREQKSPFGYPDWSVDWPPALGREKVRGRRFGPEKSLIAGEPAAIRHGKDGSPSTSGWFDGSAKGSVNKSSLDCEFLTHCFRF